MRNFFAEPKLIDLSVQLSIQCDIKNPFQAVVNSMLAEYIAEERLEHATEWEMAEKIRIETIEKLKCVSQVIINLIKRDNLNRKIG